MLQTQTLWIWVFFFKALNHIAMLRKKVTHAGRKGACLRILCAKWTVLEVLWSIEWEAAKAPEADALRMLKKGAFVSQNEEQESRYIKIPKKNKKKQQLQHVFHPGASLILTDWLLLQLWFRFVDLVSLVLQLFVCHGDGVFFSAKKGGQGSSGYCPRCPGNHALNPNPLGAIGRKVWSGMKSLKLHQSYMKACSEHQHLSSGFFMLLQDLEVS